MSLLKKTDKMHSRNMKIKIDLYLKKKNDTLIINYLFLLRTN